MAICAIFVRNFINIGTRFELKRHTDKSLTDSSYEIVSKFKYEVFSSQKHYY